MKDEKGETHAKSRGKNFLGALFEEKFTMAVSQKFSFVIFVVFMGIFTEQTKLVA